MRVTSSEMDLGSAFKIRRLARAAAPPAAGAAAPFFPVLSEEELWSSGDPGDEPVMTSVHSLVKYAPIFKNVNRGYFEQFKFASVTSFCEVA